MIKMDLYKLSSPAFSVMALYLIKIGLEFCTNQYKGNLKIPLFQNNNKGLAVMLVGLIMVVQVIGIMGALLRKSSILSLYFCKMTAIQIALAFVGALNETVFYYLAILMMQAQMLWLQIRMDKSNIDVMRTLAQTSSCGSV